MFIIFGHPRSGNTILGAILNVNPQIVIPEESDFIVPVCTICRTVPQAEIGLRLAAQVIVHSERFPYSIGRYVNASEVTRAVEQCHYSAAEIISTVYCLVAQKAGKPVAGDRSPNDIGHLGSIFNARLLDSDIQVLHLVRDPRDVYLSVRNTGWISEEERLCREFPRTWNAGNLALRGKLSADAGRYLCVRYEDLIQDPKAQLMRITAFLRVRFDPDMLDYRKRTGLYPGVDAHRNVSRELLRDRVGVYERELPAAVANEILARAREAMRVFGYL